MQGLVPRIVREGSHAETVEPRLTTDAGTGYGDRPASLIVCPCPGDWLYFRVCLRYRDVEALRAERDARTSLPIRAHEP
jgi:hypothetical protein